MSPFEINETVKVCDPKKPGDFRIISKSIYDQAPEGTYELFSQSQPEEKTPETLVIDPPSPPPTRQTLEEFEQAVKGMSDAEVKTMAEGMNIEDGPWTREDMAAFIVEQETQSRYREGLVSRTLDELKEESKQRGLQGYSNAKHETLVDKIMENQFSEDQE